MKKMDICQNPINEKYCLFVDGEFYAEGDFEYIDDMYRRMKLNEVEEFEKEFFQTDVDNYVWRLTDIGYSINEAIDYAYQIIDDGIDPSYFGL